MVRAQPGIGPADVTAGSGASVTVGDGTTANFLEAVREMEFQMLDMDLVPEDLSFLSIGFR
jgi:hypothetical protein